MKQTKNLFAGVLVGALIALTAFYAFTIFFKQNAVPCSVTPILSPGSSSQLVAFLDSAQESIDIILYQFSSNELKQAISNAVKRGVVVRIVLEPKVEGNFATADYLVSNGVQVKWANPKYANSHAKLAVVDGKKALVGSINWSFNALNRNREAAVILYCPLAVQDYMKAFDSDWFDSLTKPF